MNHFEENKVFTNRAKDVSYGISTKMELASLQSKPLCYQIMSNYCSSHEYLSKPVQTK